MLLFWRQHTKVLPQHRKPCANTHHVYEGCMSNTGSSSPLEHPRCDHISAWPSTWHWPSWRRLKYGSSRRSWEYFTGCFCFSRLGETLCPARSSLPSPTLCCWCQRRSWPRKSGVRRWVPGQTKVTTGQTRWCGFKSALIELVQLGSYSSYKFFLHPYLLFNFIF